MIDREKSKKSKKINEFERGFLESAGDEVGLEDSDSNAIRMALGRSAVELR